MTQHLDCIVRRHGFLALFWLVVFCAVFCFAVETFAQDVEIAMQEISYTTSDDFTIYGSWITAQAQAEKKSLKQAVVLLLHDYGVNRRDWGVFIPDLIKQGYRVLAIDLRGHGQSKGEGARVSDKYSPEAAAYLLQSGYLDIEAALKWIKDQKNVDAKKIAVIGVGLGADIAYLSAGRFRKNIAASVVISPSFLAVTEGEFAGRETPRAVLFCASVGDDTGSSMLATETLSNFTDSPKKVVIYKSDAHGFAIFYKHPEVKQEILQWLPR